MGRSKARPTSGHRVHKSKLHQESERARPSERLRQEGKKRSAQGQTRAEKSAVKAENQHRSNVSGDELKRLRSIYEKVKNG